MDAPLHELLQNLHMATSAKSPALIELRLEEAPTIPPEAKIALYRVAQEALNNVLKHSGARHVGLTLGVTPPVRDEHKEVSWHGTVRMRIEDDGRGFNMGQSSQGRLGLETMRERAAGVGAALEIKSKPGEGTLVDVTWSGSAPPKKAVG
jgi:signal transduction histidine kinase